MLGTASHTTNPIGRPLFTIPICQQFSNTPSLLYSYRTSTVPSQPTSCSMLANNQFSCYLWSGSEWRHIVIPPPPACMLITDMLQLMPTYVGSIVSTYDSPAFCPCHPSHSSANPDSPGSCFLESPPLSLLVHGKVLGNIRVLLNAAVHQQMEVFKCDQSS